MFLMNFKTWLMWILNSQEMTRASKLGNTGLKLILVQFWLTQQVYNWAYFLTETTKIIKLYD